MNLWLLLHVKSMSLSGLAVQHWVQDHQMNLPVFFFKYKCGVVKVVVPLIIYLGHCHTQSKQSMGLCFVGKRNFRKFIGEVCTMSCSIDFLLLWADQYSIRSP